MRSIFKFVFLIGIILPFGSTRQIQFFRKDYTYNETFDAFYKLHWEYKVFKWDTAFLACDEEGATLFYPKFKAEEIWIKDLAIKTSGLHSDNITSIFLGIHDKYGLGEFITVDGHSIDPSLSEIEPDSSRYHLPYCLFMNIYSGSYRVGFCEQKEIQEAANFVCKRENSVMCPTIDQDYKLAKSLKKCYKVNTRPKRWEEAMQTCYMEGGILTVIQNEYEANSMRDILPSEDIRYHVGTRRLTDTGEMYTVKGQKLETVYQRSYDNGEQGRDCGAIRRIDSNFYTTTTDCNDKLPFICEIEINHI